MKRALLIPYVFVTMNWAAIVGLAYYLSGERNVWRRPLTSLRSEKGRPEQWA